MIQYAVSASLFKVQTFSSYYSQLHIFPPLKIIPIQKTKIDIQFWKPLSPFSSMSNLINIVLVASYFQMEFVSLKGDNLIFKLLFELFPSSDNTSSLATIVTCNNLLGPLFAVSHNCVMLGSRISYYGCFLEFCWLIL